MAGFGIDPTSLSLRPSTLIQDRSASRAREQAANRESQRRLDEKRRQKILDKQIIDKREADFATTQFLEEQKLIRDRAKTKASLLDDIAKTKAAQDTDVRNKTWTAVLANGDIENFKLYEDKIRRTCYPETVQAPPPIQPEFQPAGAEGGYDTRLDQPMQEGRPTLEEKFGGQPQDWQGVPYQQPEGYAPEPEADPYMQQIIAGQQPSIRKLLPTPPEEQAVPVPDYLRREAGVQSIPAPKPAPAPKEEIPEAVRKSTYAGENRRIIDDKKKETRQLKFIDKEIDRLNKSIKSKELNFNRKRNEASLKANIAKKEKIEKSLRTKQNRIDEIGRLAGKEWEAKRKKLDEKIEKAQKAQKAKQKAQQPTQAQITLANRIKTNDRSTNPTVTKEEVAWADKIQARVKKAGTQQAGEQEKITVIAPNGARGLIPKEDLEEALSEGYRVIE